MTLNGVEQVTVHRRSKTGDDDYGNPVFTRESILFTSVLVGFGSTSEPSIVDGDPVKSGVTLYFPAGSEIVDGDEFEIRGEMWVKDGDPQVWVSPFSGFNAGVVVMVRRSRG